MTLDKIKSGAFKFAKKYIPAVKNQIQKEMAKLRETFHKKFSEARKDTSIACLPENGISEKEILDKVELFTSRSKKYYTNGGYTSGSVYTKDEAHWEFLADVMKKCIISNPLHIQEFIYVTQMEAEIIRWTLNLYKGDKNACGIVTSGGTESIILSMLAYRVQAKEERGVTKPNIVMSETAHCAFDKGGFYMGIEVRKVPITSNFTADINAIRNKIDSNTICLVASCPEYCYGNYDPVEQLS